MRRIQTVGQKYGRLAPFEETGRYITCRCDCGEEVVVLRVNLLAGRTNSCGCLRTERTSAANTTHGLSKADIYASWKQMRRRCYTPGSTSYKWYGGKGIKVCEKWQTFEGFLEDMHQDWFEGASLDRIDSSRDYSKENCRWATRHEQAINSSQRRFTPEIIEKIVEDYESGVSQIRLAKVWNTSQGCISNLIREWRGRAQLP